MADASREAVKLPDRHNVKAALVGIGHKLVQFWAPDWNSAHEKVYRTLANDPQRITVIVIAVLEKSKRVGVTEGGRVTLETVTLCASTY